jgi:hypothetical protein
MVEADLESLADGDDDEIAGEEGDVLPEPIAYMEEVADTPNSKLLRISQVPLMEQPESYRTTSPKEEIMMQYIRKYEQQFENLHPRRTKPMLAPRNECGVRKFICTTLRPTQLPFQEVYDYDKCAQFVADYIRYEPLELASQLPRHMPSPSATLSWQAGDCFDISQVLCSLLLGVGYDAYVVSGYAPATLTRCDLTSTSIAREEGPPAVAIDTKPPESKYTIPPRKVLQSTFLKQKAEREAKAKEKMETGVAAEAVDHEALAAAEAEELDELKAKRVHAWVLILPGKRMLEQMLFVEPSTGALYTADKSPYYGIESIWNSSNYWMNLQGRGEPAGKLSFELADVKKWEGLLYDPAAASALGDFGDEGDEDGMGGGEEAEEEVAENGKILAEMPPSWVARLHVPRDLFENRCPLGRKETVYRKGLVQKFAPYSREDGLVEQLSVYEDMERLVEVEVRQTFANRQDKLYQRVRIGEETREYFDPGRKTGLKEHTWIEDERRTMLFYSSARLDGLVSRVEEVGKKTIYVFDGSRDPLIYRSVSYHEDSDVPTTDSASMRKLAEKFRRSPEVDAEEDVCKRTFELANGVIKVRYHYGVDRVTCSHRTYAKDGGDHQVIQVDSFAHYPTDAQLLEEFTKLQQAERECINEVKDYDRQMKEELKKRSTEEGDIEEAMEEAALLPPGSKVPVPRFLTVSVYDTARSRLANQEEEDDPSASQIPHDYLTPFLPEPMAIDEDPLSRDEALQAREACLRSLKDRLVERANIIQSRLDEENAALSKKQATFQRNRDHMDPADEAEYERYCQEAMFRIQIL